MTNQDITFYDGDLIPSIKAYERMSDLYYKGISAGDFYEEPIGEDFLYPDW
tara:strand:+ start:168 stop:320 length:153 start_codon:yes stop_codon:yes gene_type:complete